MKEPRAAGKPKLVLVTTQERHGLNALPTAEKLSKKREFFCAEYVKDHNGTRAAIDSGFAEKSARVTASRLLTKANIRAEIERREAELMSKLELSAEKVLRGIANLAFFDIRKFYREDGSLKSVPELDGETQAALCGMEVKKLYDHFAKGRAQEKGTLTKIKLADRGLNLERLGRHFKLFTDKHKVEGLEGLAEAIQAGRMRAQRSARGTE